MSDIFHEISALAEDLNEQERKAFTPPSGLVEDICKHPELDCERGHCECPGALPNGPYSAFCDDHDAEDSMNWYVVDANGTVQAHNIRTESFARAIASIPAMMADRRAALIESARLRAENNCLRAENERLKEVKDSDRESGIEEGFVEAQQQAEQQVSAELDALRAENERLKRLTVLAPLEGREKSLVEQCEARGDECTRLRAENERLSDLLKITNAGYQAIGSRVTDLASDNTALRAENERLKTLIEDARAENHDQEDEIAREAEENERLHSLNAELREALDEIAMMISYVIIHGVGTAAPNEGDGPQIVPVSPDELRNLILKIGNTARVARAILARAKAGEASPKTKE